MSAISYRHSDDPLIKYILYVSVIFSIFIGLMFFVEGNQEKVRAENLKLIESSVRVDLVGMPKFTLKELQNMAPVAPAVETEVENIQETEAPSEEVVEEPAKDAIEVKKPKVNFLSKIKSLSKKKIKVIKTKPTKSVPSKINSSKLNNLILEGNKISKGSALTGKVNSETQGEYIRYIEEIPNFVRPYWKLPTFLMNQGLKCRIRVFINKSGKIFKSEIIESSGNEQYDQFALKSLSRVTLPKPSQTYYESVLRGSVVLGFPL